MIPPLPILLFTSEHELGDSIEVALRGPSPPLPIPPPISPTYVDGSLGSRAAGIRQRDALPSPMHDTEIPEMWLPLRKRLCRTTPGPGYEVGESSAAGTARPGMTLDSHSITDCPFDVEEPSIIRAAWHNRWMLCDQVRSEAISLRPTVHRLRQSRCTEFAGRSTELMDRRINTFAERQAENKRRFEDTPRNNQNQQQNKRQNTGRAYAAGNGDKKPYEGTKPLCPKCNFNHYGPCIPTCNNCKKLGHLAKDCRSRPATANNNNNNRNNNNNNNRNNNNNNNRNNNNPRAQGANTNAIVCFECGAPGHFKKDCPQWKNKNQGKRERVRIK
ncbi:putative reverse transcriptase domain-containing protein [Tanacetum coccineum]